MESLHSVQFPQLLPRAFVNYGNLMASFGRHYESLLAYDQALKVAPEYGMALGNKAIELGNFAWMTGSHELLTMAEVLQLSLSASGDPFLEQDGFAGAREIFARYADQIRGQFGELTQELDRIAALRSVAEPEEDPFSVFVKRNNLYLNLCVHDWHCNIRTIDNLFFTYITPIADDRTFQALARMFNEAKDSYITARYLAYLSLEELEFYANDTKMTLFADVLEYANYGLKAGVLKAAFSTAYGVLDKIGHFLNTELRIGLPERDIYFDRVLLNSRNPIRLREQVLRSNDPNLVALADIAGDLSIGVRVRLKEVRNAITHRKLVVHDNIAMVGPGSSEEDHVTYHDLFTDTIELLKLTKSAMIYLAAYLHRAIQNHPLSAEGIVAPLFLVWQDHPL